MRRGRRPVVGQVPPAGNRGSSPDAARNSRIQRSKGRWTARVFQERISRPGSWRPLALPAISCTIPWPQGLRHPTLRVARFPSSDGMSTAQGIRADPSPSRRRYARCTRRRVFVAQRPAGALCRLCAQCRSAADRATRHRNSIRSSQSRRSSGPVAFRPECAAVTD